MRPVLPRLLIALVLLGFVLPAGAADRSLPPADEELLATVARREADADVIFTGVRLAADLAHDPEADGFRGRMVIEWEAWLRSRAAVSAMGRVTVSHSAIRRLKEVRVEVRDRAGGRRRSFDRGDLAWVDAGSSSRGIVSLDTERQQAAVPTLRVGDLLYVRQVIDVKGMHGLPAVGVGDGDLPILADSYVLTLPVDHELRSSLLGDAADLERLRTETSRDGGRVISTWTLPWAAGGDEVRITPQVVAVDGAVPAGSFSVGATWAEVGRNYRRRIAGSLAGDEAIRAEAAALTAGCATDSQRITALYDHLQADTRYLGFYEGLDGILPETAASVRERSYGDCKGLAVYLVALLTAVGIEAQPVLVRTASEGALDPELPNLTQFNHMIAWADVGPGGMWLDATVDNCPAGMIVPQDTASEVLLLRPGHVGLRTIPAAAWEPGTLTYLVEGSLGVDHQLDCSISLSASGLAATWQRGLSERGGGDLARAVEKLLMPRSIGTRVVEHGADEGAAGPRWHCRVRSEAPLPHTPDALYLPAVLPPMPRLQSVDDAAKEEDRREEWSLQLPAGWSVAADEQEHDAGAVAWRRRVWQEEGRLRLVREITWHPAAGDTTDLKAAIREIVGRDSGFINVSTGAGR